jgi:aurora kinase
VVIPPELKSKVNNIKNRILFLSPSVISGEERECRKDDFESLANSNIGVGGFGKVYKVRHKLSKNIFAIKVINKAKIIEHDLVEQIKLEVKIMYNLNHEHVVKLYNHYEDDDNFYLILQYCAKGQLYTMLKREVRLNEKTAGQYLREVISAVDYLHSLDPPIIHRDIKPENILLDSNNSVRLGDFGWSNFFNEERRRLTYCGTPEYLAPEMIKQSGHDKSLDIWNLGVLMFELLTGSPPFEGASQNELFDNILNFRIKWPKGFSGVARDLVSKLLKTNPAERITL